MTVLVIRGRTTEWGSPRPTVRVRPAPPLDPPFDDELAPQSRLIPGAEQLALEWPATPPRSGTARPGRPGRPGAAGALDAARPAAAEVDSSAGASLEAWAESRRFTALCLEILNGYRPAGHIRRLVDKAEADAIVNHLAQGCHRLAGSSLRRAGAGRGLAGLVSVRVCEPRAGIAEAAAVLGTARRAWAFAFRLERRSGGWQCTATQLL